MAKKKKRKSESSSKSKFSSELIGLILVLVGIIGIGAFGPVGHMIKSFAVFLMGTWWAIFVLLLKMMTYIVIIFYFLNEVNYLLMSLQLIIKMQVKIWEKF